MTSALYSNTPYRTVSLETDRLILTPPTIDDFDEMHSMWSDREVTAQVIDSPLTEEEVWARLHRIVGHWALLGFGHWIVRERSGRKFAGELGFFRFKRTLTPDFDKAHEIGWMFAKNSQGLRYATEAATAALKWLEADSHCKETVCIIAPDNLASLALAKKLSYQIKDELTYRGKPMLILRREVAPNL
ncbi:GNAT family N-acetyltransferase [Paraburkholderia dilworthii]|uniref:GNAT family N-acetyltransferase n=1 Tax=Paraburkholderia dilworthii TaxID=948106 RepID=UPI0006861E4B|nr:GNAT family N-acetyltransferase [Paraburkholderia dilworthii]